ncbi:MAG: hypothetical protein U0163_19250 [Gemmatimonadaceae bacterium]
MSERVVKKVRRVKSSVASKEANRVVIVRKPLLRVSRAAREKIRRYESGRAKMRTGAVDLARVSR